MCVDADADALLLLRVACAARVWRRLPPPPAPGHRAGVATSERRTMPASPLLLHCAGDALPQLCGASGWVFTHPDGAGPAACASRMRVSLVLFVTPRG